jgi:pimeloyl-ACP methyl ester carboxylesterase
VKTVLNGNVTNYRDEGDGAAIVFIHGLGLDHSLWKEHSAALRDRYRVVRYDILGHGETDAPSQRWGFILFAKQLAELAIRELQVVTSAR